MQVLSDYENYKQLNMCSKIMIISLRHFLKNLFEINICKISVYSKFRFDTFDNFRNNFKFLN